MRNSSDRSSPQDSLCRQSWEALGGSGAAGKPGVEEFQDHSVQAGAVDETMFAAAQAVCTLEGQRNQHLIELFGIAKVAWEPRLSEEAASFYFCRGAIWLGSCPASDYISRCACSSSIPMNLSAILLAKTNRAPLQAAGAAGVWFQFL